MSDLITCVTSQGRRVSAPLLDWLSPDLLESVPLEANTWIKRLRLVRYGDVSMRERFTYRSDSLWWFTELYLHKMRRLDAVVAATLALDAARERMAPARMIVTSRSPEIAAAAAAFGQSRRVPIKTSRPRATRSSRWPSFLIGATARLPRTRARPAAVTARPAAVAFIHTAFWRASPLADGPMQESYVGAVLDAVSRRLGAGELAYVGVGPRRNFRARRWWDPLTRRSTGSPLVIPVESLAPRPLLAGSIDLWKRRRQFADAITTGDEIRAAGEFRGCDVWPVLRNELRDAALLQWPWSARAMDEAGAALDALRPRVALTYAEAGGWGRALVLEARRRGIHTIGLQHGFIYRHWLNYLHEADEILPAGADRGCPIPDRTLVFDHYAAEHLENTGHFPPGTISVTGSARLDDLAIRLSELRDARRTIRRELGIKQNEQVALVTAKFREISRELPSLVDAAARLDRLRVIIKPHPAETADVYAPAVRGIRNVMVTDADADLARLLAAADVLVTKNSTVAIDGLVLGLPALVVGLPNNLSPFVDAGAMMGGSPETLGTNLHALLYDPQAREALARAAAEFAERYGMRADGLAAERAADEVVNKLRTSNFELRS